MLDTNLLVSRVAKLKSWLHISEGLGLRNIIDDLLRPMCTKISSSDITKFTKGAEILKNAGKLTNNQFENFVKNLSNKELVYVDNKWHPVNKLNANYSDLSVLLVDLLIMSKNNGGPASVDIIDTINNTTNMFEIKNVLYKHKHKFNSLFNLYLSSPNVLLSYVKNIKKGSEIGEEFENKVLKKLKELGYKILYQGGDGDFVDMLFSTDIIVETPNKEVKTIQVKTSETRTNSFLKEFDNGKHRCVDLVIYPENGKYKVIFTKTKKETFF
jgi:hypothetical protein